MKTWWSLFLLLSAPASAFTTGPSTPQSMTGLFFDGTANSFINNSNGVQSPQPTIRPVFGGETVEKNNNGAPSPLAPATNLGGTLQPFGGTSARTTYERQQVSSNNQSNNNHKKKKNPGTIVNQRNGYVTTDRGQTSRSKVANNNNQYTPTNNAHGDAANGVTNPNHHQQQEEEEDTGEYALSAVQTALDQVQALVQENKALKRDLKVMHETEEELLYEQGRLEREVQLLQDEMVQLQNKCRSLLYEKEQLEGELYLLLLEREATQVEYTEKLSMDTRLEQAELRLRQRGIYS